MFNDIAKLIYYGVVNNKPVKKEIEVYVNKKSITRQEFYTSYQAGLNPKCIFEVRSIDYELTKQIDEDTHKPVYAAQIEYEGGVYEIIRTYEKQNGMVELTCG